MMVTPYYQYAYSLANDSIDIAEKCILTKVEPRNSGHRRVAVKNNVNINYLKSLYIGTWY